MNLNREKEGWTRVERRKAGLEEKMKDKLK